MLSPDKRTARVPAEPSANEKQPKASIVPTPADPGKNLVLTSARDQPRVDSRLLAQELRNQHRPVLALVDKYADRFEHFGKVLFQKAPSVESRTGQRERYALLTEDQAFLLLTMSRNTERVVDLKVRLVAAFQAARRASQMRQTEYLPTYHQLHDTLHALGADAAHERFLHMNVNRLVNKVAGVAPGSRASAAVPMQGMLIVAQLIAADALQGAADYREAYDRVKAALVPLERAHLTGEVRA
ncbi:Rha family transcriptional regulator [Ramlibacter sp. G-1-2-2]|uniref:Rha family transcriptional regulator n=1 Tax=Ramlibacter agri TaxID=2728837 RepID=A0A848GY57_9BURK|nr:Rha family transcriptional regulator [Ramlibacter agri]NML43515.1 Rha family transcriptional regulator [Ramlibacter agri]